MSSKIKKASLFVFEGPDTVGKTTLSRVLAEHLNMVGMGCEYFSFPGKNEGTLGYLVYRLHHNPQELGIQSITSSSRQILHIAAHIDAIENKIIPALRAGKLVILDRYWWSTLIYGHVDGIPNSFLEGLRKLELAHWGRFKPTAVFLIDRQLGGIKLKNEAQWREIKTEYKKLARQEKRRYKVYIVDNNSSIMEVANRIIEIINRTTKMSLPKLEKSDISNFESRVDLSAMKVSGQLRFSWVAEHPGSNQLEQPIMLNRISPAIPTEVFDTYWRFAAERQAIFFRKLAGDPPPWTHDSVLSSYKFTNAYRASDRVSQYLIKNVIYTGDQSLEEVFFRIILFKTFNRIETWELLMRELGHISFADYSFERYNHLLTKAKNKGTRIYSAAYIMSSGNHFFGYTKKHSNHLKLLEKMMEEEVPARITDLRSMQRVFDLLRSYPTIGDFLAYQYTVDINYSNLTNFSEMEFVVPGPGAKDGIRKCFKDLGGLNEIEIIKFMADRQEQEFSRLGIKFQSLWGRPLQLIDCQNLFCEVDKYARIAHPHAKGISNRSRIKQKYRPNPIGLTYWYPPKWGLNAIVEGALTKK